MTTSGAPLWVAIANIWFVAWAVRRKGELDYELDDVAKTIRWVVVLFCLGVSIFRPQVLGSPALRISVGFTGIAFLVWPNLAYYCTNLLRFLRLLPKPNPKSTVQGF
jgi:hypothetical protein